MPDYHLRHLPPQVWAHYHPFYGTPDGPTGKWLTWNEPLHLGRGYGADEAQIPPALVEALKHDPDRFLSPGRRDCYATFHPKLGLYDCLDVGVLSQQARWAAQAELNGFIWGYTVVGDDNAERHKPQAETLYDRSLRLMLDVVRRESLPLACSIHYDCYCWYGYSRERIVKELDYIVETYLDHPLMLHFDGRLVVFLYSVFMSHSVEDWIAVCDVLDKAGLRNKLFLVAGEVWVYRPDFLQPGLFDGFGAYNQGVDFLDPGGITDLATTLNTMTQRNDGRFWTGLAQPGFDGRAWHHPGRVVARDHGRLYESLWQTTIELSPPMVTVCSFNEWGEGTQIEPAQEYGDFYLELTAKWARTYKSQA